MSDASGGQPPPASIPGTVQLMTDEPVQMPAPGRGGRLKDEWAYHVNRRPWIVPAVLLAAGALVILRRRR